MSQPDAFKILQDLEYKAVGINPHTQKKPTGSFVSFRPIGLPIRKQDYQNPFTPFGAEMTKILSDVNKATSKALTKPSQVDIDALKTAGIGQSQMNYVQTFYLT